MIDFNGMSSHPGLFYDKQWIVKDGQIYCHVFFKGFS